MKLLKRGERNVKRSKLITMLMVSTMLIGSFIPYKAFAEETGVPECTMTIVQGKHTPENPALPSSPCKEKGIKRVFMLRT